MAISIGRRSVLAGLGLLFMSSLATEATMALSGCGGTVAPTSAADTTTGSDRVITLATVTYPVSAGDPEGDDFAEKQARIREANPVDQSFYSALDTFSYLTASRVLADAGAGANSTFSPLSLYYALALAVTGARGATQQELYALMGATDTSALATQCGNLFRLMYADSDNSTLRIANSVWLDKDARPRQDWIDLVSDQLYAMPSQVEFGTEQADQALSQWVSAQTGGTLSPQFQTDAGQKLVLLNTVYFKDSWAESFDTDETTEDVFHAWGGDTRAQFMRISLSSAAYHVGDGFVRSSLRFRDGASMTFVLPDEGTTPWQLLGSEGGAEALFSGSDEVSATVVYRIPRFGFDTTFQLEDACRALGVTTAFSDAADFADMAEGSISISGIEQGTHIAVDEGGVEASAYTAVLMGVTGMLEPAPPFSFTLDRPFLFEITSPQGVPLFVGVCSDPAI